MAAAVAMTVSTPSQATRRRCVPQLPGSTNDEKHLDHSSDLTLQESGSPRNEPKTKTLPSGLGLRHAHFGRSADQQGATAER
jgi:hypothetical protein